MDIGSGKGYPSASLSNFAGHRFVIDGVQCNSMEGFLQGLKFKSPEVQESVCLLVGYVAKRRGGPKQWRQRQTLYWRGIEMKRKGEEYQTLLNKAYQLMYDQSASFKKALLDSGDANLTHSMGKNSESDTVLTVREFCGRLTKLRSGEKLYYEEEIK